MCNKIQDASTQDQALGQQDLSDNRALPYTGDPFVWWLFSRLRIKPSQFAVLTFLAGFGMMSAFYLSMVLMKDPATRLRGLYDYRSASFGDGLILPLLAFLIATIYQEDARLFQDARPELLRQAQAAYKQPLWTLLTLLAAICCVLGFHLLAVFGPNRNWTLPVYGQLNLPGWYHALFMFFALYLLTGFAIRQWVTAGLTWHAGRRLPRVELVWPRLSRLLTIFLVLTGVFGGLLAADRLDSASTWDTVVTLLSREATVLGVYLFGLSLETMMLVVTIHLGMRRQWAQALLAILAVGVAPVLTITAIFAATRL